MYDINKNKRLGQNSGRHLDLNKGFSKNVQTIDKNVQYPIGVVHTNGPESNAASFSLKDGSGVTLNTQEDQMNDITLLEIYVNGIVSTRIRQIIKRFLKRIGFVSVKVQHIPSDDILTMKLIASGRTIVPPTDAILSKVNYLEESMLSALAYKVDGRVPHPSNVDPELLRGMLAKIEPSINEIYYK